MKLPRWLLVGIMIAVSLAGRHVARAEELDVKGVKIHYEITGKGEPVLLIHGLFASGFLNWKLPGITDELAKNYKVIAIDLPGHGQSSKPNDKSAYGAAMVD